MFHLEEAAGVFVPRRVATEQRQRNPPLGGQFLARLDKTSLEILFTQIDHRSQSGGSANSATFSMDEVHGDFPDIQFLFLTGCEPSDTFFFCTKISDATSKPIIVKPFHDIRKDRRVSASREFSLFERLTEKESAMNLRRIPV